MKRCSTSFVVRELQIKTTTIRYRYILIRMAKIQNTDNSKYWQGCGATGTLIHCLWECKTVQQLWKTVCQFFTKLNIPLPNDVALLGILPKWIEDLNCALFRVAWWNLVSSCSVPPGTWIIPWTSVSTLHMLPIQQYWRKLSIYRVWHYSRFQVFTGGLGA